VRRQTLAYTGGMIDMSNRQNMFHRSPSGGVSTDLLIPLFPAAALIQLKHRR
jgi:hypothetical protein